MQLVEKIAITDVLPYEIVVVLVIITIQMVIIDGNFDRMVLLRILIA